MNRDDRQDAASGQPAFAPSLPFALVSEREALIGRGCLGLLEPGTAAVEDRVRTYFVAHTEGPRLLVGALPYDMAAPAHLFQPAEVLRGEGCAGFAVAFAPPALVPATRAVSPAWRVEAEPSLAAYQAAVGEALAQLARGEEGLSKIVLSRSLRVVADRPIDANALLGALARDDSVTTFCVPLAGEKAGGVFLGATPELLIAKQGDAILSHPLAGSARRHADPAQDRAAADALAASEKDGREHRAVVEAILDQMAPYCRDLGTPEGTRIVSTATMWHLGTRIVGKLRDPGISSLELAALLHPTPAVCGTPRLAAARVIAALEGYERGFYAGAVGWCDEAGDGAWHVAIRCAELAGREARLYAGAGIVPGSDPAAEGEETSAKFAALLRALGIDEEGQPLTEDEA